MTKKRFVNKNRLIYVYAKALRVNLPERYFNIIHAKRLQGEKTEFIEPKHATNFIETAIYGKITKTMLDDERVRELNAMDMMQNQSIIHHPESIMEM